MQFEVRLLGILPQVGKLRQDLGDVDHAYRGAGGDRLGNGLSALLAMRSAISADASSTNAETASRASSSASMPALASLGAVSLRSGLGPPLGDELVHKAPLRGYVREQAAQALNGSSPLGLSLRVSNRVGHGRIVLRGFAGTA